MIWTGCSCFLGVESYEKDSIFVILSLWENFTKSYYLAYVYSILSIMMCFSNIWILMLPWPSLQRIKCHSNWSYFCFFHRFMYWYPVFSCIVSIFFEFVLHGPSFKVKIILQKTQKCPSLSCIVLLFEERILYTPWIKEIK